MNLKKLLVIPAIVSLSIPSTSWSQSKKLTTKTNQTAKRKLLDPANMDLSVNPGDNFFYYANGTWLKNNPIPATETRWGSFNELQENNYKALHELLESAAKSNAKKGSNQQKIGDFYKSGMDTNTIEKAGIAPLNSHFMRIARIQNADELLKEICYEHTIGLSPVFGFYISPDDKNVTQQICQFGQDGLGMPDRDYYFKTDERTLKIKAAYTKYVETVFTLLGNKDRAAEMTKSVIDLETILAGSHMTRVEMRDPYKLYNKFSEKSAHTAMPMLESMRLLNYLGIKNADSFIIAQPNYFAKWSEMLHSQNLESWKNYLQFHLVNSMASFLSSPFNQASFEFYGKTVRGQQQQKPRWKRVLSMVDGNIGELLGQEYVSKNFKPEAKSRMLALVNNLQATYADRIQHLDWMSDVTKKKALTKLNTFLKKIGYPDAWKDYSKLEIVPNNYAQNIMNASALEYQMNIDRLGKPVDKKEWGMTPPTVNAYYNPAFNEIVFPAGILQYPFFDFDADDAVNYGGIGGVIGHEMTHGFDDQGRQYDADGNLNDWWTEEDAALFTKKAQVVIDQFNKFTVLDTVHVNGELTIGENLADLGGVTIAYQAFQQTQQYKEGKTIDGLTPDQRFFLSWAQVWRANTRPEEMVSRIITDPHSPNEWRCNAPLSNFEPFYKAFNIQPGTKNYREPNTRAQVW